MIRQTIRDLNHMNRLLYRIAFDVTSVMPTQDEEGRLWPTWCGERLDQLSLPKHGAEYPHTLEGALELAYDLDRAIRERDAA